MSGLSVMINPLVGITGSRQTHRAMITRRAETSADTQDLIDFKV